MKGVAMAMAALMAWAGIASGAEPFSVLVFSKTAGYRHDSIPAGIKAVKDLGEKGGFRVEATEDAAKFTAEELAKHQVVVFLNTSGDVLDEAQQQALEGFIRKGGGYAGVHAASDTEFDWPWYGELVGAYFADHPKIQKATVRVPGRQPEEWERRDEWYNFRSQPPEKAEVLAWLDESTYKGGKMGERHPIAWRQEHDGGRSWYTGMGHTKESYAEEEFRQMLLDGIVWAAGREKK